MSKFFGLGSSGKERGNENRSSTPEGRNSKQTKKGAAKQKVDKYMEEAFKAELDDDVPEQKANVSHQV